MRFINHQSSVTNPDLYLDETRTPVPGPEEILIEVRAFGLNRADLLQRQGKYPPPRGASEILGLECSGVVRDLGSMVRSWKIGDEVCGLVDGGAYAEYCCIDEGMAWRKSPVLSWEESAAMPEAYLTAYQALFELMDVTAMKYILIHAAASGVGTAAIHLMKGLSVQKWGTASANKLSYCIDQGYERMIDYREESFREKIYEWTYHRGVDGIVDFVGGPYFEDNIWSLGMDGKLVMLGLLGGVKIKDINILPIVARRLSILGSTLRSRTRAYKRSIVAGFIERFGPRLSTGSLRPVVYAQLDWTEINRAHNLMASNQNCGKIVLTIPSK
ncbi:MAG TPA: NAD(P)H-quinone oxidoreductase [Membranihabitans sp.]|nr:NAD(P)H-quinone oxidoreductase [Membranihabitans sp.]